MAGWFSPVLVGLSVLFLARAHYVHYVLRRGHWFAVAITWLATVVVIGFWGWQLTVGPIIPMADPS